MKQFSIWRFLLAVVAFAVISQIVHTADGIFGIPAMLAMILIINLPLALILLWAAEDLAIKLLGGTASGLISK